MPLAVAVVSAGCIGPTPTPTFGAPPRPHEWACEFPKEADEAHKDDASVQIRVKVGVDGLAKEAALSGIDPGYGFGSAAVACALRQHYTPALDNEGHPVAGTTDIWVRFTRPLSKGPP
jgi:protein TonB